MKSLFGAAALVATLVGCAATSPSPKPVPKAASPAPASTPDPALLIGLLEKDKEAVIKALGPPKDGQDTNWWVYDFPGCSKAEVDFIDGQFLIFSIRPSSGKLEDALRIIGSDPKRGLKGVKGLPKGTKAYWSADVDQKMSLMITPKA